MNSVCFAQVSLSSAATDDAHYIDDNFEAYYQEKYQGGPLVEKRAIRAAYRAGAALTLSLMLADASEAGTVALMSALMDETAKHQDEGSLV